MDSIPYYSIILFLALLLMSAYSSASETALTSMNKIRMRKLAETNASAKRSLDMAENYDKSISTILVGNNVVNIGMATIATAVGTAIFNGKASTLFVISILTTIIILIFGEILPKSLAKQYSEKYLLKVSRTLEMFMKVFYPFTLGFVKLSELVSRTFGNPVHEPSVTDEDVKTMVAIGEEEGTFDTMERELLTNAIEFDDIVVREILIPRPDVVAVATTATVDEVKDIFIREKFSRLPIYENTIDNIIGIIFHRDFFEKYIQNKDFSLEKIIRKPYFVIGSVKISSLLQELQKHNNHMAIVLDEYGGTSGIVTIEDILEEIVGDIWDEHDEKEDYIEVIDADKIRIDGRLSVEEFTELFKVSEPEETRANTVSGMISDILGYLPKKGETIEYENLIIKIEEIRSRRIKKIIVEVVQAEEDELADESENGDSAREVLSKEDNNK